MTLGEMASEVELLEGAEREMALEPYHPEVRRDFQKCLRIDGKLYALHGKKVEWPSPDALRAFVFNLETAANRLKRIYELISQKEGPARFSTVFGDVPIEQCSGFVTLDLEIDKSINFHRFGRMAAGVMYPRGLEERAETDRFHPFCIRTQSEYFHELIHNQREDHIVNGKPLSDLTETLSQLGEFLYDPENNPTRNEVFGMLAEEISGHLKEGKSLGSYANYAIAWMDDAKILIWEAKQLDPSIEIPSSLDGQMEMLKRLPEMFFRTTQEQRDAIMAKYLPMPVKKIQKAADSCAGELGLKF